MLFNSYAFLFAFLPATYLLFYLVSRRSAVEANLLLALASAAFYGWWDLRYVPLLAGSIAFNYLMARRLLALRHARRATMPDICTAVAANLALLGYFKYADFFIFTANRLPIPGSLRCDWCCPWAFRSSLSPRSRCWWTYVAVKSSACRRPISHFS